MVDIVLLLFLLTLLIILIQRGIKMVNSDQITNIRNKVTETRSNYDLFDYIVFSFKDLVNNIEDIEGIKEVDFRKYEDEFTIKINGAIYRDSNQYTIYINKNLDQEKKRLTIAHELGHYFLKHLDKDGILFSLSDDIRYDFEYSGFEEREANIFAVELLMPYEQCRRLRYYSDEELSQLFKVNKNAIKKRMEYLGLK